MRGTNMLRLAIFGCAVVTAPVSVAQNSYVPIDPFTGIALPLLPTEKLIPTADGKCSVLVSTTEVATKLKFSWLGGCRFGLAHGKGYASENGKYFANTYYYGTRPLQQRSFYKERARLYQNDLTLRGQFEEVLVKKNVEGLDLPSFSSSGQAVEYRAWSGNSGISYNFTSNGVSCPVKEWSSPAEYFPGTIDVKGAAALEKAVKKMCGSKGSRKAAGVIGNFIQNDAALYVTVTQLSWQRINGKWTQGQKTETIRLCAKEPKASRADCTAAITQLISPYLGKINAVIEADKTAEKRAIEEITNRFAPLELAMRDKIRELVGRVSKP